MNKLSTKTTQTLYIPLKNGPQLGPSLCVRVCMCECIHTLSKLFKLLGRKFTSILNFMSEVLQNCIEKGGYNYYAHRLRVYIWPTFCQDT